MREGEARSRLLARQMRKAMPKAEVVLWNAFRSLNRHGYKFRRQHPIGPYIADFVHIRGRLVIEVDGATHASPHDVARDARRTTYLQAQGWNVVRCRNRDIYEDVSRVVEAIVGKLGTLVR